MNRDLLDLALISGIVGISADVTLAGLVFVFGGLLLFGREIARIQSR